MGLVLKVPTGRRVCVTMPDGRRIWVRMLTGRDGHPRLGFDAPKDVVIHREEVQEQVDAQDARRARHTKQEG